MDDISRNLGISKKTLYEQIKDKKDLVSKTMSHHMRCEEKFFLQKIRPVENPIVQLVNLSKHITDSMKEWNSALIYDLQKYHPEAWQMFEDHRKGFIFDHIKSNLDKGKNDGWYRKNIDSETIATLYISSLVNILDVNMFPPEKFEFHKVIEEMITYHLFGIVTEKGTSYLNIEVK
jgi:TetR/AcrR family transcriptional regulator, cholesterol catabolism regulator